MTLDFAKYSRRGVLGLLIGLLPVTVLLARPGKAVPRPAARSAKANSGQQPISLTKEFLEFERKGVEQSLAAGAIHVYFYDLKPGDFRDIRFDQNHLDLEVSVSGPGPRLQFKVDNPRGDSGTERVPLLADVAGRYRVEVSGPYEPGSYRVSVQPRRKATRQDRQNYLGALAYWQGRAHQKGKESIKAERSFTRALEAWANSGYLGGQADASFKIEKLQSDRYAWREALAPAENALRLYRRIGARQQERFVLNDLGVVHQHLGNHRLAQSFFDQAILLARQAKDSELEAKALYNRARDNTETGAYEKVLGDLERALEFRQAQTIDKARVLIGLGRLYSLLEDTDTALSLLGQALNVLEKNPDAGVKADCLTLVGDSYRKRKEFNKAVSFYLQAIALRRAAGAPDDPNALNNLALAYLQLQRHQEAFNAFQHCLRVFEQQGNVASAAASRTNIGWVLTEMGRYKEAFGAFGEAIEIARRKNLPAVQAGAYFGMAWAELKRDNLIAARRFVESGLAFVESLRSRTPRLRLRTSYLSGQQDFYDLRVEILMAQHRREPARGYDLKAFEASERARSRSLIDELEGRPVFPALSVKDIQQQVLGKDTVLLEYFLGRERSYLWIVTPSSFVTRELPAPGRIKALAREVHGLLRTSHRLENRGMASRKAADLSRVLLGSVAKSLAGKRILVVAPPVLQYISFAALPADASHDEKADPSWPVPWVSRNEIVVEPSASFLASLRRLRAERRQSSGLIAIVADPVYSRGDARVRPPSGAGSRSRTGSFSRLRFSSREVEAITAQVKGARKLVVQGFEASRWKVLAGALTSYRYLHFSTHGALDSEQPERSALVLSLLDRQGKNIDGFLRAGEIASLKLPVDLVVLSACKTGLGREIRGEGLVGLTQAFFAAGATRTMASLWDVDDQATATLMGRVYKNLLHDNLSPAAALREAQEWMWKQPQWSSPAYWAGFILEGEPQ